MPALFDGLQRLLDRGGQQFKFVDRTFNLNGRVSKTILEFFFDRYRVGLFVHFEMIPDRLPEALRDLIVKFPPGALQFEVGVQTFNPEVSRLISRRQDYAKLEDNIRFLHTQTGVHVHADLIVGLPGESMASFADGFDRLVALRPQEIQVGMLKRLRGTPIVRHDAEWQMTYSPDPPFEILQNKLINFASIQRLRRFARYWDLVGNSGNFVETTPLLWADATSPFAGFMRWSDWLYARIGRQHAIALVRLTELLFEYLTNVARMASLRAASALCRDFQRVGRYEAPKCLRAILPDESRPPREPAIRNGPKRQARHRAAVRLISRSPAEGV